MGKYILYAEDDQEDYLLMQQAFEEINPDVKVVNVPTGYDVISHLQNLKEEEYPSLILMDINMPLLNGKETIELLRIDDKFKNIPVICFSTGISPSEKKEIEKIGKEILFKPSLYEEWLNIAKEIAKYCCILVLSAMLV